MQALNSIRPVPSTTSVQTTVQKVPLRPLPATFVIPPVSSEQERSSPATIIGDNATIVQAKVDSPQYIVTLTREQQADLELVHNSTSSSGTSLPDNAQIIYQTNSTNDAQFIQTSGDNVISDSPTIFQNGNITPYSDYTQATMFTPVSTSYFANSSTSPQVLTNQNLQGQIVSHQGNTFLVQGSSLLPEVSSTEFKDIQSTVDMKYLPNITDLKYIPSTKEHMAFNINGPERMPHFDVKSWQREVQWLIDNYETAEGVSLPRSTLYNHYLRHCQIQKMDPMNPASFGKLIRSVFLGLRTRRLGTRGNSKYHYYGIRIKSSSHLNQYTDEYAMAIRHTPMVQGKRLKTSNGEQTTPPANNQYSLCDPTSHAQFLGDASVAMPTFGNIECMDSDLLTGITRNHLIAFETLYKEHCEAILDIVINLQFSLIEALWQTFWRNSPSDPLQWLDGEELRTECQFDSDIEQRLNREDLLVMCQMDCVQKYVRDSDYQFYQALVEILIPDVLRPIPSSLTQAIRNFAKSLETWLRNSMSGCNNNMVNIKVSCVSAFALTLRRYTSLNHLAQAARAVLQNTGQITQMLSDLNRVDFMHVQEQASWVCECEDDMISQLESDFKRTLQGQNSLEQWAIWLESVVNQILKPYSDSDNFPRIARQFLMKWSFYSSMVIRDLTLRSAASFGSFHLIRLLYDEYMFYLIEHKVASATGECPVAVMGKAVKKDIVETALDEIVCGEPLRSSTAMSEETESDTPIVITSHHAVHESQVKMSPKIIIPAQAVHQTIATSRVINSSSMITPMTYAYHRDNSGGIVTNNAVTIVPAQTMKTKVVVGGGGGVELAPKTIVVVPVTANVLINNMDLNKNKSQPMNTVKRMRIQ